MFVFFRGSPDKKVLERTDELAEWSRVEEEREQRAAGNGGEYYPLSLLQELTQELETLRLHNAHLTADLQTATTELAKPTSLRKAAVNSLDARAPKAGRALRAVRQKVRKG